MFESLFGKRVIFSSGNYRVGMRGLLGSQDFVVVQVLNALTNSVPRIRGIQTLLPQYPGASVVCAYPILNHITVCSFRQIFQHCSFLKRHSKEIDSILEKWRDYKGVIPTHGAILLDESLDYVLLVQGYHAKASWGFPKGKVITSNLG